MQTSTLVQATAEVVTILNLRSGDVYKRLEESTYGERYTLQFGVVTSVLHNGTDAAIVALEFPMDYSGAPTPKLKTFGTGSDLRLFAAEPEEIRRHFGEVREGAQKALDAAHAAWQKALAVHAEVREAVARFDGGELTAPLTGPAAIEAPEEPAEDAAEVTL